jgi:hypothetical protein
MKVSGPLTQGMGIRFCAVDSNNFYELLVAPNGQFLFQKYKAGAWSTILGWKANAAIKTGLNQANVVDISQPSTGNFQFTFNGDMTKVETSSDSSFTSGMIYFYATVGSSSNETFPSIPEDLRFKLTKPVAYP